MALIDPAGPRLLDRHTAGRQPGPTVEPPPPTARPIGSASPWAAARYAAPPISVYSRQWRGSDWARRCLPGPAPEHSSEPCTPPRSAQNRDRGIGPHSALDPAGAPLGEPPRVAGHHPPRRGRLRADHRRHRGAAGRGGVQRGSGQRPRAGMFPAQSNATGCCSSTGAGRSGPRDAGPNAGRRHRRGGRRVRAAAPPPHRARTRSASRASRSATRAAGYWPPP